MHRKLLMIAAIAAVAATAACDKKDNDAITGTTDYQSITLSSDVNSFTVHVYLNPDWVDSTSDVPKYLPTDSTGFTPTATIQPQNVAIANGSTNMTYTFSPSNLGDVNGSGFVEGVRPGSGTMTITYTDVNHDFAETTLVLPVTVVQVAAPAP
jgi:hypothetical protein